MEKAVLLYNPKAGEKGDLRAELLSTITRAGMSCLHFSMDENWIAHLPTATLIIAAGGDGTVRKAAISLLNLQQSICSIPIALLPLGTANNIAGTLQIDGDLSKQVERWKQGNIRAMDIGRIQYSGGEGYFLEGTGFGIVPALIQAMDQKSLKFVGSAAEELELALTVLHGIVHEYKAKYGRITMGNDVIAEGNFLLLEVMNIQSIGPKLKLAPSADPGDGLLEIVYVLEEDRAKFAAGILDLLRGKAADFPCRQVQARRAHLQWEGRLAHADDQLIRPGKKHGLSVEVMPGQINMRV